MKINFYYKAIIKKVNTAIEKIFKVQIITSSFY